MTEPTPQPSNEMTLNIRTANRDRKAEIAVDPTVTVSEILEAAMQNWALPTDYDYVVRSDRLGTQLRPSATLIGSGVREGDILEIQPIADAGSPALKPMRQILCWVDPVEAGPWA
jgi:hypothetical protein